MRLGLTEFIIISIVFGSFLILVFLAWYFVNRAKVRDKQFLIEKGIDLDDPRFKSAIGFSWLKSGIVVIGISLALFLIVFLNRYGVGRQINLPIILLFTGASMIVANFIRK